jgi:hypothetical protein
MQTAEEKEKMTTIKRIQELFTRCKRAVCYPGPGDVIVMRKQLEDVTQDDLDAQWEYLLRVENAVEIAIGQMGKQRNPLALKDAVEWLYGEIGIVSLSQIWDSVENVKMEPLSRALAIAIQLRVRLQVELGELAELEKRDGIRWGIRGRDRERVAEILSCGGKP